MAFAARPDPTGVLLQWVLPGPERCAGSHDPSPDVDARVGRGLLPHRSVACALSSRPKKGLLWRSLVRQRRRRGGEGMAPCCGMASLECSTGGSTGWRGLETIRPGCRTLTTPSGSVAARGAAHL